MHASRDIDPKKLASPWVVDAVDRFVGDGNHTISKDGFKDLFQDVNKEVTVNASQCHPQA
jgi:hypothetical protein